MFSTKHKVYTAEATAIDAAEDVSVEGKRYPTNKLGRAIVRHPCWMFVTVILPIAFFIVGAIMITDKISYELSDFQLSTRVVAQRSSDTFDELTTDWSSQLTGEAAFLASVNKSYENTVWEDDLELRYEVDENYYAWACAAAGFKQCLDSVADEINLLSQSRMLIIRNIEQRMTNTVGNFPDVCFANNLEYALVGTVMPLCVPATSMVQYFYPTYDSIDSHWHFTGTSLTYQHNVMPRALQNPNIHWFFDSSFSAGNQVARKMRSLVSLASSPGQSKSDYYKKRSAFVIEALDLIRSQVNVSGLNIYLGGPGVENSRIEREASKEGYKVGVTFVIVFVFGWWHCGAFTMGLYTGAQVIFVYLATCGLYAIIYKSLPLMTYSAIIWVTTFAMHGTLSFYDMFVFTSVMATKGRQNNLSVAQRMCFTMRRATAGVWIANILAIIIFAVNTTSVFNSVNDFSIFMMIAFLWNMYFVLLPTPAFIAIHHFYFSNKRRSLQKQKDIINEATQNCRRDETLVDLLSTVQQTLSTGEHLYTLDDDVMRQRLGANQGINKRRYKGFGNFLKQQSHIGLDKVRAARRDVTGAVHKIRKTKDRVFGRGDDNDFQLPANAAAAGVSAANTTDFEMDRFAEAGANPFGRQEGEADEGPRYNNARLVAPSELLHIPHDFVERTEQGWQELCEATGQTTSDGRLCPPKAIALDTVNTQDAGDLNLFAKRWEAVAQRLDVVVPESRTRPAVPLAVRAIVRSQDPAYVVGGRPSTGQSATDINNAAAATADEGNSDGSGPPGERASGDAPVRRRGKASGIVDPGVSGFGLKKLRYRWQHRSSDNRGGCCGLCGSKKNETPEQRMQRLMNRRVKQEGYTLFERFLIRVYVPVVHTLRFLLTAVLIALTVAVVVAAVLTVTAGGIPVTLVDNDNGMAAGFKALDDAYGQRGVCTFCGPYYLLDSFYAVSVPAVDDACAAQYPSMGRQVDAFLDQCGVCLGTDACLDCAGTVNGNKVLDNCGGCEDPTSTTCTCAVSRNCTYCEWALDKTSASGGYECSRTCSCGSNCDQYTGLCVQSSVVVSNCNNRGDWLEASESPTGAAMCACKGHWRGPNCEFCDCENGGMCNQDTGVCTCSGAFTGPRCQTCAASCVAHGTCPAAPPLNTWDIRTCVPNQCSEADVDNGVFCAACDVSSLPVNADCLAYTTTDTCNAQSKCFWRDSDGVCVYSKQTNTVTNTDCTCLNTLVWSDNKCSTCNAPRGGSCISATYAQSCNGVQSADPSTLTAMDACGVCGGDGICPGCDGIVGSGTTIDICGVCGGNNNCTTAAKARVYLTIDFLLDFRDVSENVTLTSVFAMAVRSACQSIKVRDTYGGNGQCLIVDYLTARGISYIRSLADLYAYAREQSRLAEVGFDIELFSVSPTKLNYMTYRFRTDIDVSGPPETLFTIYQNVQTVILDGANAYLTPLDASMIATSDVFLNASAAALSLQSLWFAVGIGLGVCFTFMLTYYVSITAAIAATLVAMICCFGCLTVCSFFSTWTVDAILQVCISSTIPIGVEYIIHLTNGYFDYLQTTTSHLFARDVTRRTAVQGATLRSLPSICTCVVCVIICSIMFDVSHLVPSKRSGQIAITLHLIVLIAVLCYSGALAALGPMKTFQHWTLSTFMCFLCGIVAVIVVLIILGVGGVTSPTGQKLLAGSSSSV